MADVIKTAFNLDLKGISCPLPLVYVNNSMKYVAVGGIIEVLVSDAGALASFPAWAKTSENEIISTVVGDNEIKFYIKRVK